MRSIITALTAVYQSAVRYDELRWELAGGLATFYYAGTAWYFEVDTAVAHVHQKKNNSSFGRTQWDDLLLTVGYCHPFSSHTRLTGSAMVGIPTHKDLGLQGIQFGTAHPALGLQCDGSFFYTDDYRSCVLGAARFLHFFPRTIKKDAQSFDFHLGNAVDLFLAHNSIWEHHRIELGYNPTFVFSAAICPSFELVIRQTNYIRSNFFGSYRYVWTTQRLAGSCAVGFSYGFDHQPKDLGSKRVITAWGSIGISF